MPTDRLLHPLNSNVKPQATRPAKSPPQIRTLAICIVGRNGCIVVNEAHDSTKRLTFCRPLGGGIEFGETGAQAVAREIMEEISATVTNVRYIGALENIVTYLGEPGHEIVLVYGGQFADQSLYDQPSISGVESNGKAFCANWRGLDSFGPELPLFPDGLIDLLRAKEAEFAVQHVA